MKVEKLRNIGPITAKWLQGIGIETREDLAQVGAVEAYLICKNTYAHTSVNLLYALHGALADCALSAIDTATIQRLRIEAGELS